MSVRPKKHLGQHFLTDENIAAKIAEAYTGHGETNQLVEIGPGKGILTRYLLQDNKSLKVIEIDSESVEYLIQENIIPRESILEEDVLKVDFNSLCDSQFALMGNMPYNISSQILFRVYEHHDLIPEIVGMFQKEVVDRIVSGPGNKSYGILSVLLQAYYNCERLFNVSPGVFHPPPAVQSAVLHMTRNETTHLDCDEALFKTVIKAAFNQRRKTLRNSLRALIEDDAKEEVILQKRPEQLTVAEFIELTNLVEKYRKKS